MPSVCTLASSSKGNSSLVIGKESNILLDVGISMRRLTQALSERALTPGDLDALLITHEHSDHVKGLAMVAAKTDVPIYASRGTCRALYSRDPSLEGRLRPFFAGESFTVGEFNIKSFPTSHDCAESVGYVIGNDEGTLALATDLGYVSDEVCRAVAGADLLLLEANHDYERLWMGPYPLSLKRRILSNKGHLNNEDSAHLAAKAVMKGTKHIVLVHLSEENNTPQLALEAVERELCRQGLSVRLEAAPPGDSAREYIAIK